MTHQTHHPAEAAQRSGVVGGGARGGGAVDVAVVGGGIIGLSVALRAAQRGLRVVVHEREVLGAGATHVAAGMLAPVSEAEVGNAALVEDAVAAAEAWPAFARELGVPLHSAGTLLVARDRDEAEALDRELAFRERLGLRAERLLPSAARRLEPALAPTVRLALHVRDDHAVDPREVLAALARAARDAGVVVREGDTVAAIAPAGDGFDVVGTSGASHRAGQVVVAAGAWSAELRPELPVRPVKGQILRLHDPGHAAGPLLDRVLRFAGGYLVPRGDGRYVLGATVEERGFDTTVTAGGVYELLRDATELVPGISELTIEELEAGLRPGTPGNVPLVHRTDDGVLVATGHFRNGILLAPLTAGVVADALTRTEVPA